MSVSEHSDFYSKETAQACGDLAQGWEGSHRDADPFPSEAKPQPKQGHRCSNPGPGLGLHTGE